ncbi:uroporphyrinogen-III C-methyltransferase [Ruminiclostridium hungatei]|uniref:uroporphyrinogen-III C-methyltransferase n=1 Tax=Ruminiclostridium hungatei TaxID=48256 RepID=A0A1V4SEG1_RUMHU|nr:uroporphyrinogen-III C-methyltransferase [Ruminiclostridium hungatei]OPX42302.1 uroporphyrinogen-III C-methyltransferase [Ruminiclostridium hungatei]
MAGKVYIIGVGPGDYKLLTLKAAEAIRKSEVIVYDRLIDSKVLSFAGPGAEFVNVGKQPRHHRVPQKEINKILLKYAMEGKTVARVKGGDPFLFGRGGEECHCLQQNGIEFEVVPGITSAIAVPAYAGIPVTHREHASSLHIITGHQAAFGEGDAVNEIDGDKDSESLISCDFKALALQEGTLIFLMGVKNLKEITTGLISAGKPSQTPAAVIENGTRPEQRTVFGTLSDIHDICSREAVKSPAVIVIGQVAAPERNLAWYGKELLSGKRIVVTRPADQSEKLVRGLESLGAHVTEFPVIHTSGLQDSGPLDFAVDNIDRYSWLVFTSSNGAEFFFKQLRKLKKDIRSLKDLKLAAVGTATEETLNSHGLYSDYIPGDFTGGQLLEGLLKQLNSRDKVLLVNSELARPELAEGLKANGMNFEQVSAYTTGVNNLKDKLEFLLPEVEKADYITFTSPSSIKAFISIMGKDKVERLKGRFICIGPVTAAAAEEEGLEAEISATHNSEGIINKIIELS